jgi:hypothetical protein
VYQTKKNGYFTVKSVMTATVGISRQILVNVEKKVVTTEALRDGRPKYNDSTRERARMEEAKDICILERLTI